MILMLKLRGSLLLLCLLLTLPLFLCREVKSPSRSKVKVRPNRGPMPARHPPWMRPASKGVSTAGAPSDQDVSTAATMAEMRFPCNGSASLGCYEVNSE
jgi:hypothetical protein